MFLYANGCSMTAGDEVVSDFISDEKGNPELTERRMRLAWPGQTSCILGLDGHLNDGRCGSANNQIVDRTFKFVSQWVSKGKNVDDLLVIINWTTTNRLGIPWKGELVNIQSSNFPKNDATTRDTKRLQGLYIDRMSDEDYDNAQFFGTVFLMQKFLERHNIKYMMANGLGTTRKKYERLSKHPILSQELIPRTSIDTSTYYKFEQDCDSMREFVFNRPDAELGPRRHPMAVGHFWWGLEMAKAINDKYQLGRLNDVD